MHEFFVTNVPLKTHTKIETVVKMKQVNYNIAEIERWEQKR